MTDPTRHLRGAMPYPLDPTALLEAQGRLLAAFARSGQIVAEAARGCAERQADLARAALHDLLAAGQLGGAPSAGDPLQDQAARLSALLERIGQEVGRMQRIVAEAQQAVLAELGRAFETAPAAAPLATRPATEPAAQPAARREAAPAPAAPAPAAPVPAAPARSASAQATPAPAARATAAREPASAAPVAAPAPGEATIEPPVASPVEPARPRRPRKVAAQG